MAVGDVVNGLSAVGAAFTFQPAASIECAITSCGVYNGWSWVYDGALSSHLKDTTKANPNVKVFINNTNYIRFDGVAGFSSYYTGIQIK